ncbi:MAG: molybdopterin converting factor subunit 1 [Tepidisphaeraceae bacterium]
MFDDVTGAIDVRITVKFFAIVRDRAGTAQAELDLGDGATVSDAAAALADRFGAIADSLPRAAFAVNQNYASKETILNDGDELAVIPPVSGG